MVLNVDWLWAVVMNSGVTYASECGLVMGCCNEQWGYVWF